MGYLKSSEGTDTVIKVTPAPLIASTVGPLEYLGMKLRSVWWWIAIVLAFPITIPLLVFLTIANTVFGMTGKRIISTEASNPIRRPTEIRMNRECIAGVWGQYSVRDITRIVIRNHVTPERTRLEGTIILDTADSGARARAVGLRARAGLLAEVEKVSFRLDLEHGGQVTTIAGGISEAEAFAIAKDIQTATGIVCQA